MSLAIMGDFDAIGETETGDFELVAAMARAGAKAHGRSTPIPRGRVRRTWQLAFAALVVSGIAAAGFAVHSAQTPGAQTPAAAGKARSLDRSPSVSSLSASPATAPSEVGEPQKDPETLTTKATSEVPPTGVVQKAVTSEKDMYRLANDARREGRIQEAISAYQKLQGQFPRSAEAHASRVSLGGLLLKIGSSSSALAQFDAYLASGGGQLAAEALFGRAQAERALGRSAEEAQNLDRLVRTYPQSAYATHAERRLRELR